MANLPLGSSSHGDEDNDLHEKEGSPLNDDIFDILFPASPDATEETEDKNISNVKCNEHEHGSEDIYKTKINFTQSPKTISNSKDELIRKNSLHSSDNKFKGEKFSTETESVLPTDDELLFDFSVEGLSEDEHEKSQNKSNLSVSNFIVLDEVNDRKQALLKSENGKKIKTNHVSEYEEDGAGSKRRRVESKNNKNQQEKSQLSAKIEEKKSKKKTDIFENFSDNEEKIELELQCADILDDISGDEMSDKSDFDKKKDYAVQDARNGKVKKRESTKGDGNKELRLERPKRIEESRQKEYDEILIIGDERLPTLTNYKNVKIIREEGLELRNLKAYIKRCGLYHDISSKPLLKRKIFLFVGLNDLVLKTVSRDCSVMRRNGDKAHKTCSLFRYKSVRGDLLNEITSQVKEISEFLPASCDVEFFDLYLFDLDKINENLSVDHYRKHGHHASLSESDIHNNKKVHNLIKKINGSIRQKNSLLHGIDCISEYQEKYKIDFTFEAKKLMVSNMKRIQATNSKPIGDESSMCEKNLDREDLRWVLNRMNKKEEKDLREELNKNKNELQTRRDSQLHGNPTEIKRSNVDNAPKGHIRKGWHSPGHCRSPEGWHPVDICRQKEQERRKIADERKMNAINTKLLKLSNAEKPRISSRGDQERRIRGRTESSRERETYKRTGTSREKEMYERTKSSRERDLRKQRWEQAKEKMERGSRNSKSLERSMPKEREREKYERTGSSREKEMHERKESSSERILRKQRWEQAKEKMERGSGKSRSSERSTPKEREMYKRKGSSREKDLRNHKYKQAKEKIGRDSRDSRSSERSIPRNKEGNFKRQNSDNYEHLKKDSPSFSDRHPQRSRSSSSTKEQESDSALSQALHNLAQVHDRSCQMYIDNPNAHPDYNKEYYIFYQAKSAKVREIGGDPNKYDFLPEWKYVWDIRSKELFREAWLSMKNQCIKMMEEKKLAQENKDTPRERRAEKDHRSSSKASKRKRSHEKKEPDVKSKNKDRSISPPIEKRQKYKEDILHNIGGTSNDVIDKSQLDALIEEELKGINKNIGSNIVQGTSTNGMPNDNSQNSQPTAFDSRYMESTSVSYEENDMDNLGLEEVGESVMPFNLGKYVPESNKSQENVESFNSPDNVLELLMTLTKLGDRMGSLLAPIRILFDRASEEKMKNRSTINIFADPDKILFMQLISNKLVIAIGNKANTVIEKVIYQEVKNRIDELLKVIEETFVEGLNVQQIAEKSLGMESSEIIKVIQSGLEISSSSSVSEAKLMKIYKAVKEKQFRYIENKANLSERSGTIARELLMKTTKSVNEKNVSPTEIPFNLPTRNKHNNTDKYNPFEEEYF